MLRYYPVLLTVLMVGLGLAVPGLLWVSARPRQEARAETRRPSPRVVEPLPVEPVVGTATGETVPFRVLRSSERVWVLDGEVLGETVAPTSPRRRRHRHAE